MPGIHSTASLFLPSAHSLVTQSCSPCCSWLRCRHPGPTLACLPPSLLSHVWLGEQAQRAQHHESAIEFSWTSRQMVPLIFPRLTLFMSLEKMKDEVGGTVSASRITLTAEN